MDLTDNPKPIVDNLIEFLGIEPTDWDDFGNVTGNDWGEITQQLSPDPDKVLISGVLQSNGPAGRQSTSTTYSNNNPVSSLMPESTTASWTWDDTFDVMTSSTDATGNNYLQQVDAAGRVTQMQWKQNASLGQNPTRPLDVNDDSYVAAIDALQIINYLNTNGETRAPVGGKRPNGSESGQMGQKRPNGSGLFVSACGHDTMWYRQNRSNSCPDHLARMKLTDSTTH
ncbi:dockerin type I domain-containing protein [Allorhodopirellula heiligendammensis]|uniref:Uncharacterized protein n=1 Tax=Allorhodopirellula heiligendammensis TaxID=2714739 RepID=A0A5C6BY34_9BACT|nr:dockerin type I domain-containing protein [Allorhodopirellula heiligendammensis]TWU16391.1 hypothetical protein Poly21_35960 [Allorhodopirellula heiligendammensis]